MKDQPKSYQPFCDAVKHKADCAEAVLRAARRLTEIDAHQSPLAYLGILFCAAYDFTKAHRGAIIARRELDRELRGEPSTQTPDAPIAEDDATDKTIDWEDVK